MTIGQMMLGEFEQETQNTRKVLERVPDEKWNWKPLDATEWETAAKECSMKANKKQRVFLLARKPVLLLCLFLGGTILPWRSNLQPRT
jgi:hypothetical protein